MKTFKGFVIGLILGAAFGALAGINIGKGRPLLSNPFAEDPIVEKTKTAADKAKKIYEETRRIIQE